MPMISTMLEHERTVGAGASLDRPSPARPRLVVVEDDTDILEMLTLAFTDAGYTVLPWTQGADAHPFIRTAQPDVVILDLWLEHPQAGSMVLGLLMIDPPRSRFPSLSALPTATSLMPRKHTSAHRGMSWWTSRIGSRTCSPPCRRC